MLLSIPVLHRRKNDRQARAVGYRGKYPDETAEKNENTGFLSGHERGTDKIIGYPGRTGIPLTSFLRSLRRLLSSLPYLLCVL